MSIGNLATAVFVNYGTPAHLAMTDRTTLAAWFYNGTTGVTFGRWGYSPYKSYAMGFSGGKPVFFVSGDGSTTISAAGPAALPSGWVFAAGVYDGATASLYVKNALVAQVAAPASLYQTPGPFLVGGLTIDGVPTGNATSVVSDIRVFGRALSPMEIAELAIVGPKAQIVDDLRLRTGLITRVRYDHSPYANHGVLTGSPAAFSDPQTPYAAPQVSA